MKVANNAVLGAVLGRLRCWWILYFCTKVIKTSSGMKFVHPILQGPLANGTWVIPENMRVVISRGCSSVLGPRRRAGGKLLVACFFVAF